MRLSIDVTARFDAPLDAKIERIPEEPPESPVAWYVSLGRLAWLHFDEAGFQAFRKLLNDAHAMNVTRSSPPVQPSERKASHVRP